MLAKHNPHLRRLRHRWRNFSISLALEESSHRYPLERTYHLALQLCRTLHVQHRQWRSRRKDRVGFRCSIVGASSRLISTHS